MVAGETGHLTLNAQTHVAEVLRHVNGNATIQVRHTVGFHAQETKMKLSRVTLTYVQVVTCSNFFLHYAYTYIARVFCGLALPVVAVCRL